MLSFLLKGKAARVYLFKKQIRKKSTQKLLTRMEIRCNPQFYWVSSRYYSPEICRWISPDLIEYLDPQSINGLNLYAYCNNDPINNYDPTGHFTLPN